MGSDVAEAQIDDLSDAEVDVLLEIYEVLRLTPDHGRMLCQGGNMYVWDYNGIPMTYALLDSRIGHAGLSTLGRPRRYARFSSAPVPGLHVGSPTRSDRAAASEHRQRGRSPAGASSAVMA
jgi:hypothetical protein